MSNNKQNTAVEQLFAEMLEIQQSGKTLTFDENFLLLEKYKEMEKEQKRIKLPSHYEILDKADEEDDKGKHYAFIRGAKWMRDKIQGGNK